MDQSPTAVLAAQRLALISAVITGDTALVSDLLDEDVAIDTQDDEGVSLLHWAAGCGHVTTMMLLITRGCDVDSVDGRYLTPLHWAAANGQTEAVRELIRKGASKTVVADSCKTGKLGTPLDQAAFWGHVKTVAALLEEKCPIDVVDSFGRSVLHCAAQSSHVEVVKELLDRGCDVNAVDADGGTPLHDAAQHGHVEIVKELVGRGCDVNAIDTLCCTSLHRAAACGRTVTVRELIRLGAAKSVVAGRYGTSLHQAILNGHMEAIEALLEDDVCITDLTNCDATSSKVQVSDCSVISTCNTFGQTPVMWAVRGGQVEVFKLLISKGASIYDKDTHSLSTFEHCLVGGQASKLSQFCEACGIRSSGEGLKSALETLITQGFVDAQKVLSLCAISGDSVFLEDQFIQLVASNVCAMPEAVKFAKYYFHEGVPFINQLSVPDETALNLIHISLLSLKCFEMGFAGASIRYGVKDHITFIKKLLSHMVLKETVHENFPNGLSPLDVARQFKLHHVAALIERVGGRPGVWADLPKEIKVRHALALPRLKEAYASIKAIAEDGDHGHKFIKSMFLSVLRLQTVEIQVQTESLLAKEQDSLWHPNAVIVGADVGPETDEHEYKSLMVPADKSKKPPPMRTCKDASEVLKKVVDHIKEINAMLNHHTGGTVHFGIQDKHNTVEEGLDLSQAAVIDKLQTRVSQLLQEFYPAVQSHFMSIHPVHLLNSTREPTGRWRFDICVSPHDRLVLFGRSQTVAYYRQGGNSVPMPADMLMERLQDESVRSLNPVWLCMMLVVTCFALILLLFTSSSYY